jgi:hypothetical protein
MWVARSLWADVEANLNAQAMIVQLKDGWHPGRRLERHASRIVLALVSPPNDNPPGES